MCVFTGRWCVSLTSHPFDAGGGGEVQQRAPRLVNSGVHGLALLLGYRLPSPGPQDIFHYQKF